MRYIKTSKKLTLLLLFIASLLSLLIFSNPEQLSIPFLIVPFLILLGIMYQTMRLFTVVNKSAMNKAMAFGLSLTLVTLLAMQSIGQLVITDVLIVIGLVFGMIFYLSRTNFFN